MKKRFLLVILTLFALLNSASFAAAESGEGVSANGNWIYVGIIVLLVATVAVSIYVVSTYLKRK